MSHASSSESRIPVAILGPTGYTGLELIEIIARHPRMRVEHLASARANAPRIDQEFPRLTGRLGREAQCEPIDHDAIARRCKLAFLCLPHEAAMEHTPRLLERGVKVVDLSAAYRLKDPAVYAKAYGHPHTDPKNLAHAVYGLTELVREQLRGATLCANPGCYPTAAALAILPLLRAEIAEAGGGGGVSGGVSGGIIINAASGVSGAGREPKAHTTLVEAGENYSAYGIGTHRHQPEIEQTLRTHMGAGVEFGGVLFVPHLLPIERGILETIYLTPVDGRVDTRRVMQVLREAYAGEEFVQVRDEAPTLHDVQRTNMVHINGRVVGGKIVLVAAIDNLVKGASGQAVQNANVMMGVGEGEALG